MLPFYTDMDLSSTTDRGLRLVERVFKLLEAARQIYGRRLARSEMEVLLSYVPVTRVSDIESRRTVEGWIEMLRKRNQRLFSAISTKSLSGVHQEANEPILVRSSRICVQDQSCERNDMDQ